MKRMRSARLGFTLIELLVVITIIGLLAAIVIPSINGALKSAKRARAMSQVKDLDGAVKRYFAEYGRMPVPAGHNGNADRLYTGADQAKVMEILIKVNTNENTRKIVFLDLDPASFTGADGKPLKTVTEMLVQLASGTPYRDPWGGEYGILMDLNFDEKISPQGSFPEIRAKSAVYSGGEKKDTANPPYKTW